MLNYFFKYITKNFRNYFQKTSHIASYFADSFLIIYDPSINFIGRKSLITEAIKGSGWKFLDAMIAIRFDEENYIELWRIDFSKRGEHCRDFQINLETTFQNDKFLQIPRGKQLHLRMNYSKCVFEVHLWDESSKAFIAEQIFLLLSEAFNFTLQITYKDLSLFQIKNDILIQMLQNRSILISSNFCNYRPMNGVYLT